MEEKKFRLSAHYVALTYPRTDGVLTRMRARDALLAQRPAPTAGCVVEERHRDGGRHLHVLCWYEVRANVKSCRHWDIDGFHANSKPSDYDPRGGPRGWLEYILKADEQPLYWGRFPEPLPGRAKGRSDRSYLRQAIGGDYAGARATFIESHPLQFAIHSESVERTLRRLVPRPCYVPFRLGSFYLPPGLCDWKRSEETLHLWGASGVGKTKLAQALLGEGPDGRYLLVRHLTALKRREEGCPIIFDDINFKCLDTEEVIHIVDVCDETDVNIKHSVAHIERGTARIVTSNSADIWPGDPAGSIGRRVRSIECKAPLHRDLQDQRGEEREAAPAAVQGPPEEEKDPWSQDRPFELIDLTGAEPIAPGLFLFPEEENDLYF